MRRIEQGLLLAAIVLLSGCAYPHNSRNGAIEMAKCFAEREGYSSVDYAETTAFYRSPDKWEVRFYIKQPNEIKYLSIFPDKNGSLEMTSQLDLPK